MRILPPIKNQRIIRLAEKPRKFPGINGREEAAGPAGREAPPAPAHSTMPGPAKKRRKAGIFTPQPRPRPLRTPSPAARPIFQEPQRPENPARSSPPRPSYPPASPLFRRRFFVEPLPALPAPPHFSKNLILL